MNFSVQKPFKEFTEKDRKHIPYTSNVWRKGENKGSSQIMINFVYSYI